MDLDANKVLDFLNGILKSDKKSKFALAILAVFVFMAIGAWKIFISPPSTKQLSFKVLDETTEEPLGSAQVMLHRADKDVVSAQTNPQGIVSFSIEKKDTCSAATASATEYKSDKASNSELISNCFDIKSTVEIKLKPEKEVSFQIVNENNGRPIKGASVALNLNSKRGVSKLINPSGVVSFPIRSRDKCTELIVEYIGYKRKEVTFPTLIPLCYTVSETTEVKLKKDVPDSEIETGADLNGKRADFVFSSLIDGYAWKLGDPKNVVSLGKPSEKAVDAKQSITDYLSKNPTFLADIKDSEMLIAIGSSSCEGSNQTIEENRAKDREHVIREALKSLPEKPPGDIPAFTLGQYTDQFCDSNLSPTDRQRRLLIVRVVKRDKETNIPSALSDAASKPIVKKWLLDYLIGGDKGNGISPYSGLKVEKFSGYNKLNPY